MLPTQIPDFFKNRRNNLMTKYPTSTFILPAAKEAVRNLDVIHSFRQESNFFYLCGLEEPDAFLVLAPSSQSSHKTILFVLPKDLEKEMWIGERYGVENAKKVFDADEVYPISEFDQKLPEFLKNSEQVFYRVGLNENLDRKIFAVLEKYQKNLGRSGKALLPILDPTLPIGEMRIFKNSEEISFMKRACEISTLAHKTAMKEIKPGMNEYEIEALLNYIFKKHGCQRLAYPSIVAGGKNAACLHYQMHNEPLKEGDLVLIDAAGEFNYYPSDITRTFPVGKHYSEKQSTMYDLVLKSQLAGIAMAKPKTKLADIHKHVCEILIDGFLSLGLLSGDPAEILKSGSYKKYYPHNTSHWLGMDVHDVGLYTLNGESRILEPGMTFTIEPGFYIQPNDTEALKLFPCQGIRIEDDILITQQGCEILSAEAPKTREDIEKLR
ncbi:MAG: aminopeptidase P N-terminal domain-containing protein [Bdellovibrio sp.]|nr:aminopeptidase P N-terminal domain-containing protein [Bdellovibrio sp.]